MALIIDSATPEEIGRCVSLIKLIPVRGSFISPQGRSTNNAGEIPAWLVTGDVKASLGDDSPIWAGKGWSLYPPQYLMPIDGDDFGSEDQHQNEQEVNCES
ncbi:TPA: hypothetical protein ACHV9Z_005237 [Klebsiella pneumoniae]